LSLILYAVRFVGYTLLSSPELFLILELLKPFCTTLLLIAVFRSRVTRLGEFSPKGRLLLGAFLLQK
jgi:hypothetical protein